MVLTRRLQSITIKFVAGLALIVALALTSTPTATFAQAPFVYDPNSYMTPLEQEVVYLTNLERIAQGCAPLQMNDQLAHAAYDHSWDMADNSFVDHTGSNGSSPAERIEAAGYDWRAYGENVAGGQATAAEVVASWMNSSGHRANILNCSFTEIGVGYDYYANSEDGHYWTQVFGTPW